MPVKMPIYWNRNIKPIIGANNLVKLTSVCENMAFLKDADIIILDEATAFADPENEHLIQESFKKLSKNKTTLMIAHRLSTVIDADKILVIDKGKIIEEGKHADLINMNGHYKKLWEEYQKSVNWKIGG